MPLTWSAAGTIFQDMSGKEMTNVDDLHDVERALALLETFDLPKIRRMLGKPGNRDKLEAMLRTASETLLNARETLGFRT